MNKIKLVLAILGVTVASSAFAVDGTINFSGLLVSGTCSPTVTGGGATASASPTITLPTVNVSALNAATLTAGNTAFSIALNGGTGTDGCIQGGKTGTPYFEPELAKINANGRVTNTGPAKNVDIQILTDTQQVIDLSKDSVTQVTPTGKVATNNHTYNYFARYYATGATEAGAVAGSVSYSIIYK